MNKIPFDTFENILTEFKTGKLRAIGGGLKLKRKGICIFHPHIVSENEMVLTRSYQIVDGVGSGCPSFHGPFSQLDCYTDGIIKLEGVFIRKHADAPFAMTFDQFYTERCKVEDLYAVFDKANPDWREVCHKVYDNVQMEFKDI